MSSVFVNGQAKSGPLHPSLLRILPPPERDQFRLLCKQRCALRYPPLNLSSCQHVNIIMSPADDPHEQWTLDDTLNAPVSLKRYASACPTVLHVRAVLVGRLSSDRTGALCLTDAAAVAPIVIAPPPPPSMRNACVYASNWRFIPAHHGAKGYFEVLLGDLVPLTPQNPHNAPVTSPINTAPLVSLRALVTAKSCIIASRKQSCCFLAELSGTSDATMVVFRDDAVAWWPFLQVGSYTIFRGLRLCSLPSYSRRTVFLASGPGVVVVESGPVDATVVKEVSPSLKPQHVAELKSGQGACERCPFREPAVHYDGLITEVLADGRFKLDDRVTFHPGPIHSFGSNMTASSNLRKGTKIKVFNAHLVQRYDDVRLFPTAKSSIEVLYFGELKSMHNLNKVVTWRQSEWDRLWKRLDRKDVLWAEEMYDMLVTKFWHWLRGSSQPESEGTDRDRIACLLGDQNDVGLVQYVMHLLSGREDLLSQDGSSHRDVYKEFLEPPAPRLITSQITLGNIPTLKRLKEMVLVSQVNKEHLNTEPSLNRVDSRSVHHDVVMLRHTQIVTTERRFAEKERRQTPREGHPLLSGLLHTLKSEPNRLMISDASNTLPVRIVGQLEPALIGAIVLVTDYYVVVDFREGEHESVTAVFAATGVKTIVDGPYVDMGTSAASGPLVCETQACSRRRKTSGNKRRRISELEGSIVLTRRARDQSASGQDSQAAFVRIADVPLICMFVDVVRSRDDRTELGGKLLAIRSSQRKEAWEIILRDEEARIFWDCKLVLSGDAATELAPVFQENRLWGVSCLELSGERDVKAYIWRKGSRDAKLKIVLSSTFNRVVPWVEDLGKGEYMRYANDDILSDFGVGNLSEMSGEGKQYSLVRDAVESFSAAAAARVRTALWELYDSYVDVAGDVVNVRGSVARNSVWGMPNARESATEWVLTIRDDDLGIFAMPIDFRDRRDCLTGLAPGMRVLMQNIHREREEPWSRCRFRAGVDTVVRCVSIAIPAMGLGITSSRGDYELLKRLPRVDLVDFESRGEKWVGVLRFDVLEVLEVRLCAGRQGSLEGSVEMGVTVLVEDGSTKGRLRSEGFENCCVMLGLSPRAREHVVSIARERGAVTVDVSGCDALGLEEVFLKRVGWRSFTGVVLCDERVKGEEVLMKCFNLGFGSRVWTACLGETVAVECVMLLGTGVAALRARVCALEDGLDG